MAPGAIFHVGSLALTLGTIALLSACTEGRGPSDGPGGAGGTSPAAGGSTPGTGSTSAGTGGTSPGTGGAGGGGLPAQAITPDPIISRGKPAFASTGDASLVNDGKYRSSGSWGAGNPTPGAPAWVAINVGSGYKRLLLSWTASGNYNYTDVKYGAPADYTVETSSDSTNGADGTWKPVKTVTGNTVRTRAHSFEFSGESWVRLVVTQAPADTTMYGVQIDEIDVHDLSKGAEDTWFFFGDSITAFAYDRDTPSTQPSFQEDVHQKHDAYFPAMINGGIGGELTSDALARIDQDLELNPDFHFFAIGYGTNDSWGNKADASAFKANLQTLIDKIVAAGRVPLLAHIPYSPDGNHDTVGVFNKAIDELTQENGLVPGPDLFAWFQRHPDQLMPAPDLVHPLPAGRVAMNKLWADAADGLYAPKP